MPVNLVFAFEVQRVRRTSTIHHAEATYPAAAAMSKPNCHTTFSPSFTYAFPICPSFCATSKLDMPSITIKPGLDHLSIHPHHDEAVIIHGCIVCENALKHTRRRNECTGTCSRGRAGEPQSSARVPCISACMKRSKESRRKAWVDSVESVSGRKMRI